MLQWSILLLFASRLSSRSGAYCCYHTETPKLIQGIRLDGLFNYFTRHLSWEEHARRTTYIWACVRPLFHWRGCRYTSDLTLSYGSSYRYACILVPIAWHDYTEFYDISVPTYVKVTSATFTRTLGNFVKLQPSYSLYFFDTELDFHRKWICYTGGHINTGWLPAFVGWKGKYWKYIDCNLSRQTRTSNVACYLLLCNARS